MKVFLKDKGEVLLPDFFIVGAAKSGTTSLHSYLNEHPEVFMPPRKETWFFSFVDNPPRFVSPNYLGGTITRIEDYVEYYSKASSNQILGDASPSYLYTHDTSIRSMKRIYENDEAWRRLRFIILLRNPVERAWSQYWMFKRKSQEPLEFEDAIRPEVIEERIRSNWNFFYDYIGFGRYNNQVKAYLDSFGAENVKVILFDELKGRTLGVCRDVFRFLGVGESVQPHIEQVYNMSGKPKSELFARLLLSRNILKRMLSRIISRERRNKILRFFGRHFLERVEMSAQTRRKLIEIYSDDVVRLQDLIQKDLSAWLD